MIIILTRIVAMFLLSIHCSLIQSLISWLSVLKMMITDYRSGHVGMQLAQFVQKGIVGRHRVEFPHVLVHYGVEFGVGMVGHLLVLVLFLLVVLRFRFEHIWVDLKILRLYII